MKIRQLLIMPCLLCLAGIAWSSIASCDEIHDAAKAGDVKKVQALLTAKPDLVNAKTTDWGVTPLFFAANKDMAELLLSKGADVNAKDNYWFTPLVYAVSSGNKDVVELLLSKGAEVNVKNMNDAEYTPLLSAARSGNKDIVELFLAKGLDVNAKDKYGNALANAASSGHRDVVELLLSKGADINVKDGLGRTVLFNAAESGSKDVVELFLTKGFDVNAKSNTGETPLVEAARSGNKDVVELLLIKGADVNANKSNNAVTPLHAAAGRGSKDVVELLLSKGADVAAKDDELSGSNTPLFYAANKDVAELLLGKGADINAKNKLSETPLFDAASHDRKDVVELLLSKGADVNAKNNNGQTLLYHAAASGDKEMVKLLLSNGADLSMKDAWGKTPMQAAQENGKMDIVELLRKPSQKASDEILDEGLAAARQQQWTVAIRYFLKAQAVRPTEPEVLFNLGLAESKIPGRELRAMAWLQAYLLSAPDAANASAVRTEIVNLKMRVEGAIEKLVAQAKQLAGQFSRDDAKLSAFCDVAIAQARTGDTDGAELTFRKAGVNGLDQAKKHSMLSDWWHFNQSFEYKIRNPLPTMAKDRLDELLKLVNKDMSGELFTDPQSAFQTIATKKPDWQFSNIYSLQGPELAYMLKGTVYVIEQLADTLNDIKNLNP